MREQNTRRDSVVGGLLLIVAGAALVCLPLVDTDESQYPSGKLPVYLLGAGFVASSFPVFLNLTCFRPVTTEMFVAVVLSFCAPIMLALSWGPGSWSGGIPNLPPSWNDTLGDIIGTIMGFILIALAIFFWQLTLRQAWAILRKQ